MRSAPLKLAVLLIFLVSSATASRAEQWHGIIPLKSIRADVERLLGKPSQVHVDSLVTYKFEHENVTIRYITDYDISMCKDFSSMCHCGIPKDFVSEIDVSPKIKAKFSALKLDKSKLSKLVLPEDTNVSIYGDDEAGIDYWVLEREDILDVIRYVASAKECAEIKKKRRG